MKLFACLLLAIGIVIGLAAHKPAAMAMMVEQSSAGVEIATSAEKAGKPVLNADVVDAGHCSTPAISADTRDAAAAAPLAMAWISPDDGVDGVEPPGIGRPPNLV